MSNVTTIELKKTTHKKLKSIGGMTESFDDVVNRLIKDNKEIDKYIKQYILRANGKCICEVIFGRTVIANHEFIIGRCIKCGIQKPSIKNQVE